MKHLFFFLFQELFDKRQNVLQHLQELQNEVTVIIKLLNDEDVHKNMETMRDTKVFLNYLMKTFDVSGFSFNIFLVFVIPVCIFNDLDSVVK